MRATIVLLHRYVGLVIAGFLLVAGITGAAIVWNSELDSLFSSSLRRIPTTSAGRPALDPFVLREKVSAALPCADINYVDFRPLHSGVAISMSPSPGYYQSTGKPCQPGYDEVFVDPATGSVVGRRKWGEISEGWHNFMPFLYRLHFQLALGVIGSWAFGIIALLWTADCFIGAYLTFPNRRSGNNLTAAWFQSWKPAWKLRWRSSAYKINFDLHRAGGLWLWALLLVFAWSSVSLNFQDQVYKPVMSLIAPVSERDGNLPMLDKQITYPRIGWRAALIQGKKLMQAQGIAYDFAVLEDISLGYDAERGLYSYTARTTADIREKAVFTNLYFDGNSGSFKSIFVPTGRHTGDTITMWLWALHLADIWGMPYRIIVTFIGLAVAMLSITGAVIWWRKRKSRRQYLSSRSVKGKNAV